MSSRNDRYTYETAMPGDAAEILDILEEADFKGKISLTYTRRPDPYVSFKKEGREVTVFVSREKKANRITSIAASSINRMFLNGEPADVGYIFGLRVRKEYRRKYLLLPRGYEYIFRLHEEKNISFFLTTILEENEVARKLLEKRRPSMPIYDYYGDYETYALKTGHRARRGRGLRFRNAEASDVNALIAFLHDQGRRFQFYPILESAEIMDPEASISYRNFYLLCDDNDEIAAAGTIWDQRDYKQYLLNGYGGIYKYLYPVSFMFPLFGYPRLARPGSILDFFTLSFWAVRDDDEDVFECFLSHLSAITRQYSYFVLGMDTRHPLREALRRRPHLLYPGRMYLVYPYGDPPQEVRGIDRARVPYLEIGRL
ncbi:hypothetical protein ACFL4G_11190 [Thermodesulfobacteriota bacterium]